MSRRRPHRVARPVGPERRPDSAPSDASTIRIVLTTTLALGAGVVVFSFLLSPTSMVSAMMGVEAAGLTREKAGRSKLDGMYQRLQERMSRDDSARPQQAVGVVLRRLLEVEAGRVAASQAVQGVRPYAAADPGNLLVRLGEAVLQDAAGAGRRPIERFAAMGRVIDAEPRAVEASVRNGRCMGHWWEIVRGEVRRADVAARLATTLRPYQVTDQFAALPIMARRVSKLAADLRGVGQTQEAERCLEWLGKTCVGLIKSERDAGTRLLAAEALAKALPADAAARAELEALRAAYHAAADRAPTDLSDGDKRPAIEPLRYRLAVTSLLLLAVLVAVSFGGLLAIGVAAMPGALFRGPAAMDDGEARSSRGRAWAERGAVVAGAAMLLACILGSRIGGGGAYSSDALAWSGCWALACGAAAAGVRPGWTSHRGRRVVSLLGMAAAVFAACLPNGWVVRIIRHLQGAPIAAGFVIAIAIGGLLALSRMQGTSRRQVATSGLSIWGLGLSLAIVVLPVHVLSDHSYQRSVVAGSQDEIAARLGADWMERLLPQTLGAYGHRGG